MEHGIRDDDKVSICKGQSSKVIIEYELVWGFLKFVRFERILRFERFQIPRLYKAAEPHPGSVSL